MRDKLSLIFWIPVVLVRNTHLVYNIFIVMNLFIIPYHLLLCYSFSLRPSNALEDTEFFGEDLIEKESSKEKTRPKDTIHSATDNLVSNVAVDTPPSDKGSVADVVNLDDWVDPGDMFAPRGKLSKSKSASSSKLSFEEDKQSVDNSRGLVEAKLSPDNCDKSTCIAYVKRFIHMLLGCINTEDDFVEESDVYKFYLNVELSRQQLNVMQEALYSDMERIYELDKIIQKIFSRGSNSYWSYYHMLLSMFPSIDLWSAFNMIILFFGMTLLASILTVQCFGVNLRRLYMLMFNLFIFGFAWNAKYIYVKRLMEHSTKIESCKNTKLMWIFYEDDCVSNLMSNPMLETKPLVVFAESLGDLFHIFGLVGKYLGNFCSGFLKELTLLQGLFVTPFMAIIGIITFYILMSNINKLTFHRSIEGTSTKSCSCPTLTSKSSVNSELPELPKPKLKQLERSLSDGSLRKRAVELKQKRSCFTLENS